jgi:nicotinate-nucleotide pyrophosphorylase (carboxylating)
MALTPHPEILSAVQRALEEDIASGDITSQLCVPENLQAAGRFLARERLVLAGVDLLGLIYEQRGGVDAIELRSHDGDLVQANQVVATVRGRARTLLECERVALNFLQRLSGVATLGRAFVDAVSETDCRILDTRKTTPGLRRLEKMAAAAGGVTNHRMGLYDAVLIKNNHIAAAGGVKAAIESARRQAAEMELEVEVRDRVQLMEALAAGATHLLFDNLSPDTARDWVSAVQRRATIEISGGVTLETAAAYARTGADYVSVGAITHSARAMDLSFRLELI